MKTFLTAIVLALLLGTPAWADGYFKGKSITYIVATSPGGGYDTYSRLIGQYLARHLGAERVVFKNLPGAGHIIGTNELAAAKPDGLTIGTFNTGLIYAQLLQQEGIRFDLKEMSWIGKAASDSRALVLSKNSGLTSFDDLLASKKQLLLAASGVGSANYTETKLLADGLDLNIKMVAGYNGNEGEMAMLRGEVVGQIASYESLSSFVDADYGFYALAIGGNHEPQAITYAKNDKAKAIVNFIDANSNLGRLTAAPPGVPADVLEELRDGYMAAMADPALLADAARLGIPIDPARGDEVERLVKAALDQTPETVTLIAEAVQVDIPTMKVSTEILSLEDGNKTVGFMSGDENVIGSVSGSRTKLTVNEVEADRKSLAVGMMCDMEYNPASDVNEFISVDCFAAAPAAEVSSAILKVAAAIDALADDNKEVSFQSGGQTVVGSVSSKRTALTINGADGKREALAVGMLCDLEYDTADNEFKSLACNN